MVSAPDGSADTVTVVLETLAVTVPEIDGRDETVTVVEARVAVTVPEIDPIVTDGVPIMPTDPVTVVLPEESTRMALRFVPSDPP